MTFVTAGFSGWFVANTWLLSVFDISRRFGAATVTSLEYTFGLGSSSQCPYFKVLPTLASGRITDIPRRPVGVIDWRLFRCSQVAKPGFVFNWVHEVVGSGVDLGYGGRRVPAYYHLQRRLRFWSRRHRGPISLCTPQYEGMDGTKS